MKHGKLLVVLMLVLSLTACGRTNEPTISDGHDAARESGTNEEVSAHTGTEAEKDSQMDDTAEAIFFGEYPQAMKEAEPIEWIILDRQDGRTLLLANDCIDSLPWHDAREPITWDNCDLRAWLNGDFLQTAFSADERERILLSDLENGDDYGYGTPVGANTQDKVFLLSTDEVLKYLSSDSLRTVKPTAYAVSHGAYTNGNGDCAWWLRSPGMTETSPAYIASAGSVGNRAHEVNETIIGVRPAIWIKSETKDAESSKTKPISNVSEIWAKYDRDPQKYEATYDGELITATGVVNYIGRDSHGTPSMELADAEGGTSYVLGVFGSFDEMSAVSVGDTVTISGYFHIMSSENMVVLKRCEIQEIYNDDYRTLVAYYSMTGNTKRIAEMIAETASANLFQIETAASDGRSFEEKDIKSIHVDNWDDYNTVYIGYPIWSGIAAEPMKIFVEANDFTGKTVIPFCTSGSTGIGESGKELEALAGTGNWLEGESFWASSSEDEIVNALVKYM